MQKASVFGENPKSAENAGADTNLGITYGANPPPLHLPCTRLFRERFPATLLPHLAVQLTEGAPWTNVFCHASNFPAAAASFAASSSSHHEVQARAKVCSFTHQVDFCLTPARAIHERSFASVYV